MHSQTMQFSDSTAVLVQTQHLEWDQGVVAYCCVGLKKNVSKSQVLSDICSPFRWHTGQPMRLQLHSHAFLNVVGMFSERQLGGVGAVLHTLRQSQ